ncbi:hypothetical protein GCM10027085_58570 [Spirosoma aerophilum]
MSKITTDHFFKAAGYIDQHGIPKRRGLRDWAVSVNNRVYPVKYMLSVARFLSGDNKDICNGSGFITNDARAILEEYGLTPIEVEKP